ncbi:hypothetical protein GCM10010472_52080 [Pseudonocardia halophobica]|uniref:Uncharacterized protein n=1 Tax=Pseudonocardia halophobica TaxID=29401 RepID=A0A9W6L324_9PSEU|nr:hypothetical protein [Pseudonocardia halophobica]GLL11344.1 hypothetical protein GCM10017577_24850 [Pseudonocardia halophobica]
MAATVVSSASGEDYYGGEYLQDMAEQRLIEFGGERLRLAAHDLAGRYVDERYPWDGRGDEPADRLSAYIAMLWQVGDAYEPGGEGT